MHLMIQHQPCRGRYVTGILCNLQQSRKKKGSLQAKRLPDNSRYVLYKRYKIIFGPNLRIYSKCHEQDDDNEVLCDGAYEYEVIETHKWVQEMFHINYTHHDQKQSKDHVPLTPDIMKKNKYKQTVVNNYLICKIFTQIET